MENRNITLLVHTEMATLNWGKVVIEAFHKYATKNGVILKTVYHWKDAVDSSVIVLIGVDDIWLKDAFGNLDLTNQRVILIDGVADEYRGQISYVLSDQDVNIRESLELLKSHGRNRTALFGVQKNDTSDISKAVAFSKYASSRDVYYVDRDIDACFDEFITRVGQYDSVICSNDIMAIYLSGRFGKMGIKIPEEIHLVGNGNLWLGAHITPALTTVAYDVETMVMVTLQMCKNLLQFEKLGAVDIHLKGELIKRESTSDVYEETKFTSSRSLYQYNDSDDICEEIYRIDMINRVLSSCTQEKRDILRLLAEKESYSEIAEKVCLSEDTVKYHIKKLYKELNIHSREELCELVDCYGIKL